MIIQYNNDPGSLGIIDCLRNQTNTTDLSSEIEIFASSTLAHSSQSNNYGISIILEDNDKRWLSEYRPNQYFEIRFLRKSVYLYGYTMKWPTRRRFNENWIVEGWNGDWFLVDKKEDSGLCKLKGELDDETVICEHEINSTWIVDYPSVISRVRFTAVNKDSNDDDIFSLSYLQLFGFWGAGRGDIHKINRKLSILLAALLVNSLCV